MKNVVVYVEPENVNAATGYEMAALHRARGAVAIKSPHDAMAAQPSRSRIDDQEIETVSDPWSGCTEHDQSNSRVCLGLRARQTERDGSARPSAQSWSKRDGRGEHRCVVAGRGGPKTAGGGTNAHPLI